jgi:hypothetical protein
MAGADSEVVEDDHEIGAAGVVVRQCGPVPVRVAVSYFSPSCSDFE